MEQAGLSGLGRGLGGAGWVCYNHATMQQPRAGAARSSKKQYWQSTAMPKDGKGCHAHWIIGAGREKAWRKFACASRAFRLVMTSGPAKRGNRERPSHWSTRKPKRPQRLPSGPSQLPTQPSQAKQSQSAIVAQAATPARDSPILTPIGRNLHE